jgi:hypothetical protein
MPKQGMNGWMKESLRRREQGTFIEGTGFARSSAELLYSGTGGESKGQKKRCESSNHNRGRNKGKRHIYDDCSDSKEIGSKRI